jgi:hypothetical protein
MVSATRFSIKKNRCTYVHMHIYTGDRRDRDCECEVSVSLRASFFLPNCYATRKKPASDVM